LKLAYESSGLEREKAEAALERDVKVSFHNLLYLERSIELTRGSMETLGREYGLARVDYRNGRISELQLLSTQVAYKNMEPMLASQITSYKELRSSFFLLLGIDSDDQLELEGTIELPADIAEIIEINPDLTRRFDIAAIDVSLDQTKINRQSTLHQSFFPSLTLSASYQPVVSDPLSDETWDEGPSAPWTDTGSVSLTVAVPLDSWLPGSAARNSLAALDADLDILAERKETTARNALAEIELLKDKLNDSLLNIASLELNLQVARRAYELTEEGYRAGTQEFLALEGAEDDLNNAEQNLLQEKLNFLTTLFDFEYALNTELTEGDKQ
jgi:multidrug efflux system outer membrane protein